MIQVLVWVEFVRIDLGWIITASLTTASFVIPKTKNLIKDYTDKFETSIETPLLTTSLRRVSSHVCLSSLLAILI